MEQKKSYGQASYDLLRKPPEKINVIDMQREMQKSVEKQLEDIIAQHRSYAPQYFILYMLRKDRLVPNSIKQQFIVRKTRPKPDYDTSLFSYDNASSTLKFHWSIPDENTCIYLLHNKDHLLEDEKELFSYVKKFSDGTLE